MSKVKNTFRRASLTTSFVCILHIYINSEVKDNLLNE